jgi:N-acetylglucosaminyl-diphospho-decaprenol L-rhamnosyltransferase
VSVELSFCVVNTEQRGVLRYCLDAIARERATVDFATEVIVLDNASRDGSAAAARDHPATTTVIELTERRDTPQNDSELLTRARGRFVLLLNDDSELEPGAAAALHAAMTSRPRAGAATAMLVSSDGTQQPSAWRLPSLLARLFRLQPFGRWCVQSRGGDVRTVGWARATALLVRREAAEGVGGINPALPSPRDAVDFCRRLRGAGWETLYVPGARAVHQEHPPPADTPASRRGRLP